MKKILVVDDDFDVLSITAALLETLGGYAVVTAENGAEALQKFQAEDFDLIITDIEMPVMNGIELVKAVRGLGSDVPMLARSGKYGSDQGLEFERQLAPYGIPPLFDKALSMDELFAAIEAALQKK